MTPSIRVDQEVYDFLKERAEPFVDTPNSVLRRMLALEEEVSAGASNLDEVEAHRQEREAKRTRRSSRRPSKRTRKSSARAPRGSLLPESEYELPLLGALAKRGGSAPSREVIEAVGEALESRLTALDREKLKSGVIRWQNRTQFVRLRLVEQGFLMKESPRGSWTLTEAGRKRAAESHVA